ncbi:unnamed protein product [Mytilus coruscus]|uniref:TIR domain-containing protein n=1 Tax=Mytilus coruscus TaxID=42192 RepID=A0A6J8AA68_MYTCO|nr:unnamed protein product [Mytilus coruscus]
MEHEEGVKLCVHHRDFDVGESITENIDKYLERSWKVVIIIPNAFAKSEWCQWEVDVVQERRRRHGRHVVLLIMLESIDSKHMTSRLRTLLDSVSPIMNQKGLGEVLFWKVVIESLRKPSGDPQRHYCNNNGKQTFFSSLNLFVFFNYIQTTKW